MTLWDIIAAAAFVLVAIFSLTQGVLRQLMTLAGLYFAATIAGFAYPFLARFMTGITSGFRTLREAIGFGLVFLLIVIIFEVFHRKGFPDTKIVKIKFLDNLLAILPGILAGLILATIIFTSLGHAGFFTQEEAERMVTYPFLSQFAVPFMATQRVWFPSGLPLLMRFLLPDANEL